MKLRIPLIVRGTGAVAGVALLATLAGCVATPVAQNPRYGTRSPAPVQVVQVYQQPDDFDYYPAYEVYYSRNRREYVYRDRGTWVRGPEPRGVSLSLMLASPAVRVDFHDSPDRHHENIVRTYPRHWRPEPPMQQRVVVQQPQLILQARVAAQAEYEYYPAYETYYSRSRNEYVYHDGRAWVRRPEPRGVSVQVIRSAPSVPMEFRDEPERHHGAVQRAYPKNWKHQDKDKDDRKGDRDDDRRGNGRRN
jgi:hypothetical protein